MDLEGSVTAQWLGKRGREGTAEEFALVYDKYPPRVRLTSAERALSYP